ncbi:hypothetical protein WN51_10517 [Melipona quadrifasciata]|uniref:Uncharacterized protein n=1 Tax=Melipona quadrifasciata TaxID=166423 RepID=A0A0N0U6R0_9HYME|nr:hypothetical protein WN51_10517 [Melipona quadrifasciata]
MVFSRFQRGNILQYMYQNVDTNILLSFTDTIHAKVSDTSEIEERLAIAGDLSTGRGDQSWPNLSDEAEGRGPNLDSESVALEFEICPRKGPCNDYVRGGAGWHLEVDRTGLELMKLSTSTYARPMVNRTQLKGR